MGDRASMTVTVYACPREQARVVTDAVEEAGMEACPVESDRGLVLGRAYDDGQTPLQVPGRLAEHLAAHAPGATFTVHGGSYPAVAAAVIHYHVPGLGLFTSEATDDEAPRFSADEVHDLIDRWVLAALAAGHEPRSAQLHEMVRSYTGAPWRHAIETVRDQLPHGWGVPPVMVRPVWPCEHCGAPVREQDPGTRYVTWVHADTGARMRACLDGAALAVPDRDSVPVFYG